MEYYNDVLCISYSELTNNIMSPACLHNLRTRGKLKQMRRGCYGTPALFLVDSLPLKYKKEVYFKYPQAQKQKEDKSFRESIEPDTKAILFYSKFVFPDGRFLPFERQEEYANNAAILNLFRFRIERSLSQRKKQGGKKILKTEFWKKAAEALSSLDESFPHSLPLNPRRLQARYNQYVKDDYKSLVSKTFMQRNAAKIDDDVKESLLIELIADPRNLNNSQIQALYNIVAEKMEWKKISASAVNVWREKYDLVTAAGRIGKTNFRNQKTMQVKRIRPTLPLLYWTMDGWDVELLYQQSKANKNEHDITTYHNRLTVVIVLDPCINYPVGYAIGEQESPELITAALRNAVNHTAELFGIRYCTNQLQCDHYALKKMTPVYNAVSKILTPAKVKNAKAKVIEPYFGRLNKKYCQQMPNWSGFGITSDKNKQPNIDFLNANKHTFPDKEGCYKQIESIIGAERNEKLEHYLLLWKNLPQEKKIPLSEEEYLFHFGAETGFKNTLEGNGLLVTIEGVKRAYDCFDIRFRQHAYIRWVIKYDPQNKEKILAINKDGTLRFLLEEKHLQPMALAERKENDAFQLQRVENYNKELEEQISEWRARTGSKTKELFEGQPALKDTLGKIVICDSLGQHKNIRNKVRHTNSLDAELVNQFEEIITEETCLFDLY